MASEHPCQNARMWDAMREPARLLGLLILTGACLLPGCGGAVTAPRSIAATLVSKSIIEEILQGIDPEIVVEGMQSGGGGGGSSGTLTGATVHASYAYTFRGNVRSKLPLKLLTDALRKGLPDEIQIAGGRIHGRGGGPTTEQRSGEPERTVMLSQNWRYKRQGYHGDVFMVVFPRPERSQEYVVIVRTLEILVGR